MKHPRHLICALALIGLGTPANAGLVPPDPYGGLTPIAPAPSATGMLAYRLIARAEASAAGLPYDLVDAVMRIESNYDPSVVGGVGEIGLMQVRPTTAVMLGFRGLPGELADPAVNIHYGATYLGQAWHLTNGNVCRTLMKYRAGHGEETMSTLSASYCARAKAHLVAMGSPLAAQITPVDLIAAVTEPVAASPASLMEVSHGETRPKTGAAFWTAFKARIRRIDARIEAKWGRVASR